MRLIDADKIDEELESWKQGKIDTNSYDLVNHFQGIIRTAPTVEERKHGHWIDYQHGSGSYCSYCNFKIRYKDKNRFKLCPNCGAIMDEKMAVQNKNKG